MAIAYSVIAFYGALVMWVALLAVGFRKRNFWPFLGFGILIALVLNIGYFVKGQPASIAFFISIYDVFDNIGLGRSEGAPALAQCVDNACTVWGDRYVNHPSWGVAFYDRFANGPQLRTNLLYAHIAFNSIAFVLLHIQLWKPGTGANPARHRLIGKVGFAAITLGTVAAVWMASEHGDVSEYGGVMAQLGFYSMSIFVYGAAIKSVASARKGDIAEHRKWSIRYAGAMWGAFWIFRAMLVVTGPLLRSWESVSLLLSIWLSAPIGILIAERFRTRKVRSAPPPAPTRELIDA